MNLLLRKAKTAYGFTDYELSLIRYTLTAIFYDISKLILFGFYYGFRGMFPEFLFAVIPLILLRTRIAPHFSFTAVSLLKKS